MKDFEYVKEPPFEEIEQSINYSLYWFTKEWLKNGILIGQKIIDKAQKTVNKMKKYFESDSIPKEEPRKLDEALLSVFKSLKESNMFKDKRIGPLKDFVKLNRQIEPMIKEDLRMIEKFENERIYNEIYGHRDLFIESYLFVHLLVQSFRFLEKLKDRIIIFNTLYEKYSNNIKHIKEVRNIFEHYEEYIVGEGRYKKKNFVLKKDKSLLTDATSIYVEKDNNFQVKEITIGGRIKVKHSVEIMKIVLTDLIILYKKNEKLFKEEP